MSQKSKAKAEMSRPWNNDLRKRCLRCFASSEKCLDDVHDVDIRIEGSEIPYRTRLCVHCRKDVEILVDRGLADEVGDK